ncbi:DUF3967 domain-containing protein (plasmid) [Bacillus cereus]
MQVLRVIQDSKQLIATSELKKLF